jgi:hypothetical protein
MLWTRQVAEFKNPNGIIQNFVYKIQDFECVGSKKWMRLAAQRVGGIVKSGS